MAHSALQWHRDIKAVKANQNVVSAPLGLIHLVQAVVSDCLAPGELTLLLKTSWETEHGLLWVLLTAIPLQAGISKCCGRQGMLGDAITHLSGTRGLMPLDASCPQMAERVTGLVKLWVAKESPHSFEALASLLGHLLCWAEPRWACWGLQISMSRANGDAHMAGGLHQL